MNKKITLSRGDIWLVNLEPTIGKEIKKTRPCIVLQNDYLNGVLRTTMVAPITSTIKDWPFSVILKKGEGGLKTESMILLNQIRTTDHKRFIKKYGAVSKKILIVVDQALIVSFQISRDNDSD